MVHRDSLFLDLWVNNVCRTVSLTKARNTREVINGSIRPTTDTQLGPIPGTGARSGTTVDGHFCGIAVD